MTARTAACSCGQLSAAVDGDPVRVSICHCLACQRRTGSVFGAQARFPRDSVSIHGDNTAYVRVSDDGNSVTFRFCPVCGSTLCYIMQGLEDFIAIPVGAFADPQFPAPSVSVYEERRHTWVELPQGVEHSP